MIFQQQQGQCAAPQRLQPAARYDAQQPQQRQQQHPHEHLSLEPSSWESSPGSDSSRAPPESLSGSRDAAGCLQKWVPLGQHAGEREHGSGADLALRSLPSFLAGHHLSPNPTLWHSEAATSSFPGLDASRKRPFTAASPSLPTNNDLAQLHCSGTPHATRSSRQETPDMLAVRHTKLHTKPGRVGSRLSPSSGRLFLLPVSNSWHPEGAWHLSPAEEVPECMLTVADPLQLSATAAAAVASDQDSAGQEDMAHTVTVKCTSLNQSKDKDAAQAHHHRASCSSAAEDDHGPGASIKPETHAVNHPVLNLLPLDMSDELAALERALSLPSSVEELQEGLSFSEIDNDLMRCIRKRGKGGRNPASDARLDPNIDPKKAMRIMANRMSAARSKLRQKLAHEGQRVKLDMLALQKTKLSQEIESLEQLCRDLQDSQVGPSASNSLKPNQEPWPSNQTIKTEDSAKQSSPLSSHSNAQPGLEAAERYGVPLPGLDPQALNLNSLLSPDVLQQQQHQQHQHQHQHQANQPVNGPSPRFGGPDGNRAPHLGNPFAMLLTHPPPPSANARSAQAQAKHEDQE